MIVLFLSVNLEIFLLLIRIQYFESFILKGFICMHPLSTQIEFLVNLCGDMHKVSTSLPEVLVTQADSRSL